MFNDRTREVAGLRVWKDTGSGIIYIDDFYTVNETYVAGSYRDEKINNLKTGQPHFERNNDAFRRKKENLRFVTGKKLLDFGCGSGDFLNLVKPYCTDVVGAELQQNYIMNSLKKASSA